MIPAFDASRPSNTLVAPANSTAEARQEIRHRKRAGNSGREFLRFGSAVARRGSAAWSEAVVRHWAARDGR